MLMLTFIQNVFDLKGLLLLGSAILVLLWLIYFTIFFFTRNKLLLRTLFYPCIMYAFFMLIWILINTYFHSILLIKNGEYAAIVMDKAANIASLLIFISAFIYSCHLTSSKKNRRLYIWQKIVILFTLFISIVINLLPNSTVSSISINGPSQFTIAYTKYTLFFFLMFFPISFLIFYNIFFKNKKDNRVRTIESKYIGTGFAISALSTITIHLIITYIFDNFSLTWLPPVLSSIELLIIGYAIVCHRFYSWQYLLYILINFIAVCTLYIIPTYLMIHYIESQSVIIISIIWSLFYGLHWKSIWRYIGQYISLLIYGKTQTPVDEINALSHDFQASIHQAMGKLSELLHFNQQQLIISDANKNKLYTSYLSNNDSVLLIDEVEYRAETTPNLQLKTILNEMSKHDTAMILPLYDHQNTLTRLLITPHKANGASYSNEEILALQRLLKKVQAHIYSECHIEKAKAMAHSIAHEMHNSFSQIQLRLEDIDRAVAHLAHYSELYHEIMQAKAAIYHGNQIIDLMLQEAQHPTIDQQSIHRYSISQLVQAVINDYAFDSEFTEKRVTFNKQNDFTIVVNDVLFSFILFNLLRNAIYYFNEYPESTIEISLETATQENLLHFKDYGPGIETHVQQRIFDDFFTYQKSGGTGLGLSYCQRVMNLFKGHISCDSVFGQYTIFTLHFPKIDQGAIASPGIHKSSLALASPPPSTETKLVSGSTIYALVADDNLSQRRLVRFYLEKLGINVEEAENGQQAIEKVQSSSFDLVFLDIQMPVMDGFQACQSIKALYPQLPIIALSGENRDEIILQISQFMDDRLFKPTTRKHLETILTKWVPQYTFISKME